MPVGLIGSGHETVGTCFPFFPQPKTGHKAPPTLTHWRVSLTVKKWTRGHVLIEGALSGTHLFSNEK